MRRFASALIVFGVLSGGAADAAVIDAIDSGWYSATGLHIAQNENYLAGDRSGIEYRNFVVFDLASVTDEILTAELHLYNPDNVVAALNGYISPDPTETFALYDVTTPIDTLRAPHAGVAGITIYNELGSGTLLGQRTVSAADNGTTISIAFNADGLAALNAARGGLFAIGGALTSLGSSDDEYVFGFSQSIRNPEVRALQFRTATVAEPATVSLLGLGLLVAARRRLHRVGRCSINRHDT